jgi:hypothetical protein
MESRPDRSARQLITFDEMKEALLREEIVLDVARQLEKDFGMWGMTISFSNDVAKAYDELYAQVYFHITELSLKDTSRLKNLLYQIDISAARMLREPVEGSIEEELSHKIIERELQKVLLRRFYKL